MVSNRDFWDAHAAAHTPPTSPRMLFSRPPWSVPRPHHRASVPPIFSTGLLMMCIFAAVCESLPAISNCRHRSIDCVLVKRHPCTPGSPAQCGPCLEGFQENHKRHCVEHSDRTRPRHKAKEISYHDLDEEEIDSVIEKEQILPKQPLPPVSSSSQTGVKLQADTSKQKPESRSRSSSPEILLSAENNTTTTIKPTTPAPQPRATGARGKAGPVAIPVIQKDGIIVILISVCVLVGTVAVIMALVCGIRLQRKARLARKVDYPAFGVVDSKPPKPPAAINGTSVGDKTLAQSVQMYHYQHQKQQMLSMGRHKEEKKITESVGTSDDEEMGGDFTVYECPGLAPTGEMEVKNPLFDDSTLHYQGNHK